MKNKTNKKCAICRQIKPSQNFSGVVCSTCRATGRTLSKNEDDEGGGGKQLQHSRDAKQLQYEMELEAVLLKELENQKDLAHNKDLFGMSALLKNEQKKQAAQRELLDRREDALKAIEDSDEPNPDLAVNAQIRREKITRLFSITRSCARNYVAANNAKVTAQKSLGIFSAIKKTLTAHKTESILSTKSSGLFSQQDTIKHPAADEAEKLINAIRTGQKIFNK